MFLASGKTRRIVSVSANTLSSMTFLSPAFKKIGFPLIAAGVTIIAWASAFVALRHLSADVSAGALSLGRMGSAALSLTVIVLVWQRFSSPSSQRSLLPRREYWPRLLLSAATWFAFYHLALNQAVHYIDAGTASLLINTGPILIALMAGVLLGEGFPKYLLIGLGVAFFGVGVIAVANSEGVDASLLGIFLCVGAAMLWAIGAVSQKPLLDKGASALHVTWWACSIGALICLPFAPALASELNNAGMSTLWWVVYLGLIPTALGFTTWSFAITRLGAGNLAVSIYLVPPTVILMAWALIDEVPPLLALGGGALCLVGVAISRYRPAAKPTSEEPRLVPAQKY